MNYLILCFSIFFVAAHLLCWQGGASLFQVTLVWGWAFLPAVISWRRRHTHPEAPHDNVLPQRRWRRLLRKTWNWLRNRTDTIILLWMLLVFAAWGTYLCLKGLDTQSPADTWTPLSLAAILWFVAFIALTFADEQLKTSDQQPCLRLYDLLNAWNWLLAAVIAALLHARFSSSDSCRIAPVVLGILSFLPAIELLCRLLRRILPQRPGRHNRRRPYELYLFEVLSHPRRIGQLFKDSMSRQLGLETAGEPFLKLCLANLLPLTALSLLLLWLLTATVVLEPGYQALVLRFGKPTERILTEGLSFKAPWPMDTVRIQDVSQVRHLRVGSHQPKSDDEDIYRTSTPILWTNNHGVTEDQLLIVAAPRDMMAQLSTEEKTPSISLVGADITVQYRIGNLRDYLLAGNNVRNHLYQIAMQLSSRALFRYDVDELFCQGRIELPRQLHQELQHACNDLRLGIRILNVGLGGVHPPQQVANDFQSTVSALQQKTTMIESARQEEIQNMARLTGTVQLTKTMLKDCANFTSYLPRIEGDIASLIGEAKSYRCEKVNDEMGKSVRFRQERLLYQAAPAVYLNHRTMSSLEKGLQDSCKYMLIGDRDKMILRFNNKPLE